MQLVVKPFLFPVPIVKEGQIDMETLNQLGKDEVWLENRIKTSFAVDIKEILLATVDSNDEVRIFTYK